MNEKDVDWIPLSNLLGSIPEPAEEPFHLKLKGGYKSGQCKGGSTKSGRYYAKKVAKARSRRKAAKQQ